MELATTFFGVQNHVSWWQECLRAALIFGLGLTIVRLGGRRSFSKWSAIDIIVAITAGSNLSRALTGSAPFVGTVAATIVIVALHAGLAHAAARSAFWSRILEGPPIVLGRGGRLDAATLRRNAISNSDLEEALRQLKHSKASDTKLIVLEPSGKINSIG